MPGWVPLWAVDSLGCVASAMQNGESVTAALRSRSHGHRVTMPISSLNGDEDQNSVEVTGADGTVTRIPLQPLSDRLGRSVADLREELINALR